MTPEEQMLSDVLARSLSLRDTIAYLISREAERAADVDAVFREFSEALDARLDELSPGLSSLKDKVRAENDWVVGAARAFLNLRRAGD